MFGLRNGPGVWIEWRLDGVDDEGQKGAHVVAFYRWRARKPIRCTCNHIATYSPIPIGLTI